MLLLLPTAAAITKTTIFSWWYAASCILGTVRGDTVPSRFEVMEWDGKAKEEDGMGR